MKHIILTALLAVMVSCSVVNQPRHSATRPPLSPTAPPVEVTNDLEFVTPTETELPKPRVAPTMSYNFTKSEREHIKFSTHYPFQGDSFTLNLNKEISKFVYPLPDGKYSSGYGSRGRGFHSGVDLLQAAGKPILAAFDGVVRISKPYAGYGNVVVLRHSNGLETVYSHNTKNMVAPGQFVKAGDQIATVGRTGTATANHLHFEVRILGQTIDPQLLIDTENRALQSGNLEIQRHGTIITARNSKMDLNAQPCPNPPEPTQNIASTPPPAKPTSNTTAKPATSSTSQQSHKVVKGDTLSAIARKYGTSTASLCRLNGISDKTILRLGQKIRVK